MDTLLKVAGVGLLFYFLGYVLAAYLILMVVGAILTAVVALAWAALMGGAIWATITFVEHLIEWITEGGKLVNLPPRLARFLAMLTRFKEPIAGAIGILGFVGVIAYLHYFPSLPLQISFRQATFGSGQVAVIKNTVNAGFPFSVLCQNPKLGKEATVSCYVSASGVTEVGWFQGWTWQPGDRLAIAVHGFRTLHAKVE